MVKDIKQHLRNIWSSIHEKVKQHWDWVEKSVTYKKMDAVLRHKQWNMWAITHFN